MSEVTTRPGPMMGRQLPGSDLRIAVVNRGDAAMRVVHAVRELNLEHGTDHRTIVLHVEEEAGARFVELADEAYCLGPARLPEADSTRLAYLDLDRLAEALRRTRADAAWVGWGFVAERPEFAERCAQMGVVLIGPSAAVMRKLGDKIGAKQLAESVSVPVVPWSGDAVPDARHAKDAARRIGYPVLVKATAGGGGRGIRVVSDAGALPSAFAAATREAASAFGDGSLFVEKVVEGARHVEVQVAADDRGTAWAVGARDCTIQRRRQKIVEESGVPGVPDAVIRQLCDAAVRLVVAARYTGVGTVEFLLDPRTHQFFFMEVNTRLQVEHTVTEQTTGLDLVKLQLGLALGRQLVGAPPLARGCAVEARVTTEDAAHGFRPAPGVIEVWEPASGPGLRFDTGLGLGDVVPPDFDPLAVKVIAWGADRAEALARLRRALADTQLVVRDGATTLGFLRTLLARPEIAELSYSTEWVDELLERRLEWTGSNAAAALLVAAVVLTDEKWDALAQALFSTAGRGRPEVAVTEGNTVNLTMDGVAYQLQVHRVASATYLVGTAEGIVTVERFSARAGMVLARCGDEQVRAHVHVDDGTVQVDLAGDTYRLQAEQAGIVRAQAPSVVVTVRVAVGQRVSVGDPVAVVESMKLETVLRAPSPGVVREVWVRSNDQLAVGTPLLRIDCDEEAGEVPSERASFAPFVARTVAVDEVEAATRRLQGFDSGACVGGTGSRLAQEGLLRCFACVGWLTATRMYSGEVPGGTMNAQEALASFLRAPDRSRDVLPDAFLADLGRTMEAFGAPDLEPGRALHHAAYRVWRALSALGDTTASVREVLREWLAGEPLSAEEQEAVEGLVAVPEPSGSVGDLARALLRRHAPLGTGDDVSSRLRSVYGQPASARTSQVGSVVLLDGLRVAAVADGVGEGVGLDAAIESLHGHGCLDVFADARSFGEARLREVVRACPDLDRITVGLPGAYLSLARGGEPEWSPLHPATAERLELWRLANFVVEHRQSHGDVHLLEVTGRDNAGDRRMVVLAGVAELTGDAAVAPPELADTLLEAFAMIRDEQAAVPARERSLLNRVVVYVTPPWTTDLDVLRRLAWRLAPAARDVGIATVITRVRVPGPKGLRERVLHLASPSKAGMRLGETDPSPHPMRTISMRQQRLLRIHRRGLLDPYEIADLMTSRDASSSDFPPGRFVEHDLGTDGALTEVRRPPGENTAGVVVGIIENFTEVHPEGMVRVAILSDPNRGLGALAEPECRRIEAAIDLADKLGVPVEWFTVSAGAKIAMDSGTENLDWVAQVLRRIVRFTQGGGEINVVVAGVNVGAQPYFNAEATMLMHTRGVLIMTPASSMVLTGKEALDFAGSVSAEDNTGIGGFDRIMGPNGQAQLWAPTIEAAFQLLFDFYERTYVVPGERHPRRRETTDPADRDIRAWRHPVVPDCDFETVGDIFSTQRNPDRKKPFDMRTLMRSVTDVDREPLERWAAMAGGEPAIVWETFVGGMATTLIGIESRPLPRGGVPPSDGPQTWSAATLFPRSAKKVARALNAASGRRPVVVLANLAGFDGSPESLRELQLEYGAEIGRAVVNFAGPILFCVVSRYHGGAFVVFSKRLNDELTVLALEGAHASVIGGSAAAAVVFAREVERRVMADPRVARLDRDTERQAAVDAVRGEVRVAVAREFDGVHNVERAQSVGSIDRVITASALRSEVIAFLADRTRS